MKGREEKPFIKIASKAASHENETRVLRPLCFENEMSQKKTTWDISVRDMACPVLTPAKVGEVEEVDGYCCYRLLTRIASPSPPPRL